MTSTKLQNVSSSPSLPPPASILRTSTESFNVQRHISRTNRRHETLSSLIAGVGSGAASSIACAPLDLVRTRMQVMGDLKHKPPLPAPPHLTIPSLKPPPPTVHYNDLNVFRTLKNVLTNDGISGCFRGLGMTLLTVPTFWGLYFPLYETFKFNLFEQYSQRGNRLRSDGTLETDGRSMDEQHAASQRVPVLVHMTSAIFAGAVADFFCNPMFVVRTRMQTEALHGRVGERPVGIKATVAGLYREGGGNMAIFWRGYGASLMGLSHVAIQFPLYEWLKAEARHRSPDNECSTLEILLASAVSKMAATSLTYPHEVIRSRMMDYRGSSNGNDGRKLRSNGILATLRRVTSNDGYIALYTGVHVSLIRVVPNCCVTFMTYEMILQWARQQDPF